MLTRFSGILSDIILIIELQFRSQKTQKNAICVFTIPALEKESIIVEVKSGPRALLIRSRPRGTFDVIMPLIYRHILCFDWSGVAKSLILFFRGKEDISWRNMITLPLKMYMHTLFFYSNALYLNFPQRKSSKLLSLHYYCYC